MYRETGPWVSLQIGRTGLSRKRASRAEAARPNRLVLEKVRMERRRRYGQALTPANFLKAS